MFYIELENGKYKLIRAIKYYSERYQKSCNVDIGYISDGATGAVDIFSEAWWIHDKLCDVGKWDDGTPVTNLQASMVIRDVLMDEGRYLRAQYWFLATFLFGGGKARENGMW